jgi:restriction system protein
LAEAQRAGIDIVSPSVRLILDLQAQRLKLENLAWRQFEELVEELLRGDGYTVQLTKKTRDGGVDILAEKCIPKMGMILSVWQAKKMQEGNKVGLRVIRELADTRNQLKASKGVIVTSTSLTRDAIQRIQSDKYLLEGFQKPELLEWIRQYRQGRSHTVMV